MPMGPTSVAHGLRVSEIRDLGPFLKGFRDWCLGFCLGI